MRNNRDKSYINKYVIEIFRFLLSGQVLLLLPIIQNNSGLAFRVCIGLMHNLCSPAPSMHLFIAD